MKEEVTAITIGNDSVIFHTANGVLRAYGIAADRLFHIHIKSEDCKACLAYYEKLSNDREDVWSILEKVKIAIKITAISVISTPNANSFTAVCNLSNGEQCTMIPSDALALALTQGKLGVDFRVYVDSEEIKQQEAREKAKTTNEILAYIHDLQGFVSCGLVKGEEFVEKGNELWVPVEVAEAEIAEALQLADVKHKEMLRLVAVNKDYQKEIEKYKQFRDGAVAELWKTIEEKEKLERQIVDFRKWLAGAICRSESEVIDAVYSICQTKFVEVFDAPQSTPRSEGQKRDFGNYGLELAIGEKIKEQKKEKQRSNNNV